MQTTSRQTNIKSKRESKDDVLKKQDDNLKKGLSTPKTFVQKSTTADIYAQKKKSNQQSAKAPKKVPGTSSTTNVSPMKGLLKSSASSISQISKTDKILVKSESKTSISSARRNETPRKPVLTNVTVNSPGVRRKLNLNSERTPIALHGRDVGSLKKSEKNKESGKAKEVAKLVRERSDVGKTKEVRKEPKEVVKGERQRTKTRTLEENEVKILKADVVQNNAGMLNLSQKLVGGPKAFYVNLDEDKVKLQPKKDKSSDEEISYEDDFESYESDFESYHSDQTEAEAKSDTSEQSEGSETSEQSERSEQNGETVSVEDSSLKEKDEEKMLDSGNFDLRDQRSAKLKPVVMDFILEGSEDRKPVSLTDEGFQDMSSSSAASSLKTQQADRPLFLDFTKSKQSKQKRKIYERLQQRAKDLLGMITLHAMSYSLYEMQPIAYDLYMATFGRSNYTQVGVQTFDDGITEEIQTDEVPVSQKWSQHPVEFSKSDVYLKEDDMDLYHSKNTEDYLAKFTFMLKSNLDEQKDSKIISDENYKINPLRMFLEQKDGAGGDEMLPFEIYKSKLKSNDFNSSKMGKFLKKFESRISHVLSSNTGHKDVTDLVKSNKIPFSKGYFSLSTKTITDEKLSFLKDSKILLVFFSDSKPNLILTVHKKSQGVAEKKSLICQWDLSVARSKPIKVLTAIDDVVIGRYKGNVKGVFVAALKDGSIHLWDLSEEPTWHGDVASENKLTEFVEADTERLTEIEKDREWNLRNSHLGLDQFHIPIALQSCAYTSSAANIIAKNEADSIVGLEMNMEAGASEAGRRVVGQVLSLQRSGVLTIWSIIQEKLKPTEDMGRAYFSKMTLEKCQTIHMSDHIDISTKHTMNFENYESFTSFNLNAAKKRLALRKKEKCIVKNQNSRPQSAVSSKFDFDTDRPYSAASMRKRVLPVEINLPKSWETGVVCNDLKIMRINNVENYLVAKNCGEILCCKRCLGAVKIERFTVTTDTSSVTNLEVSNKSMPYFLAATDTGTVNLCSLLDNRVLLTLDCRNVPSSLDAEKCFADSKGRFISSVKLRRPSENLENSLTKLEIKSIHWSAVNPCSIYVLLQDSSVALFELTHSDIYAKYMCENAAVSSSANDVNLALLTPEGEIQVHRLANELQTEDNIKIFQKYVALL